MKIGEHKKAVKDIFSAGLEAVDPYKSTRLFSDRIFSDFQDSRCKRLLVVGFGKASCPMARAIEELFSSYIDLGIVITKYGHTISQLPYAERQHSKISIVEAGHPVPDENGFKGTEEIVKILKDADENTFVLCLISGGGSALLVSPYEGITLPDKQTITDLLLKSGADITELNTVRKHISRVKGGRLAENAYPARVMSLIISDVIGDRLDVIASGPTSPDSTTYYDALNVIGKYGLRDRAPLSVLEVLKKGAEGLISETPKENSHVFERVEPIITGNNKKALEAAKSRAESLLLDTEIISSELTGEAKEVGKWLAEKAIETRNLGKLRRPCCLISGGETTVTVKGNGLGGRNTELALAFAIAIKGIDGITLLSAGTDGTDGPTDAAGAIVDRATLQKAAEKSLSASAYLAANDSHTFLKKTDDLLITGPTGTNVMDIQVVLIQ